MEENENRKQTYLGLLIWTLCFVVVGILLPYGIYGIWPNIDVPTIIKMMDEYIVFSMVVLMLITYKMQTIYWVNSISYQQASRMTSGQRKTYGLWNLKIFTLALSVLTVYNILGILLNSNRILDICVGVVTTCAAGIFTFRLRERK